MTTTHRTITIEELHAAHRTEVSDMAEESPALDPEYAPWLPIVRPISDGRYAIVDGFSRIAGMVAHGASAFPVIIVEDADDLCAEIDCDSVIGDCPELDAIYAAAGEA